MENYNENGMNEINLQDGDESDPVSASDNLNGMQDNSTKDILSQDRQASPASAEPGPEVCDDILNTKTYSSLHCRSSRNQRLFQYPTVSDFN